MKHIAEISDSPAVLRNPGRLSRWRKPFGRAALILCLCATGKAQGHGDLTDLSLEQLRAVKVSSASLHDQTLENAPASITVITAEEIRRFGYRTLAEALAYVRGFFTTTDDTYTYLGVRGSALPGDYASRVLVMIDGHNIAENVNLTKWFGEDFPLDISLVDRIEVLRGASSALYGSSGMLATINVITRRPAEAHGTAVRVDTGSLGERKVQVSTSLPLPAGANLLLSASAFHDAGAHQLYFRELDSPEMNFGRAIDMDGQKGYHAFADLTWGNWEVLALAGDRVKTQPISWGDTIFNDRGTSAEDSRAAIDLIYSRDLPGDRSLSWRTSYDAYRYRGIYHYAMNEGVEDNRERDYGDAISSKFTYRIPDSANGHLTVGAELRVDLRVMINVFDVAPEKTQFLMVNQPDRYAGLFAQQEWTWGKHWEMNLGARVDWSWLKRSAVSPRAALIFKPVPKTDLKLLYSRGFRNPSTWNMFYDDDGLTQIANPGLRPETSDTYEIDLDKELTKRVRFGASVYRSRVNQMIEQIYTSSGAAQFVNAHGVSTNGASLELQARLPAGIDCGASIELQRSVYLSGAVLPNSPGQVGKLRLSMPLWRDRLSVGAGFQALGERVTYAGASVPWVILPEAVISTRPLIEGIQFSAGVKNLSNSFYRDPAGLTPTIDSVTGAGRTYYLSLAWHSADKDAAPKNKSRSRF